MNMPLLKKKQTYLDLPGTYLSRKNARPSENFPAMSPRAAKRKNTAPIGFIHDLPQMLRRMYGMLLTCPGFVFWGDFVLRILPCKSLLNHQFGCFCLILFPIDLYKLI